MQMQKKGLLMSPLASVVMCEQGFTCIELCIKPVEYMLHRSMPFMGCCKDMLSHTAVNKHQEQHVNYKDTIAHFNGSTTQLNITTICFHFIFDTFFASSVYWIATFLKWYFLASRVVSMTTKHFWCYTGVELEMNIHGAVYNKHALIHACLCAQSQIEQQDLKHSCYGLNNKIFCPFKFEKKLKVFGSFRSLE